MATSLDPSQIKKHLVRYKLRLEQTTDEQSILQIIHKLSKVPITLDLLQGTGAGKIVRTLSKGDGLVGQKAASLLKKWREGVAVSQKSTDASKQNQSSDFESTENLNRKHVKEKHSKEKHSKENNLKDKTSKSDKDTHIKEKHKHAKEKHFDKHGKHNKEKHSSFHTKNVNKEENFQEQKEYSPSNRTSSKYFAGMKHDLSWDEDDENAYNPEAVSAPHLSKNKAHVPFYEPTPKKIKLENDSSNHKSGNKSNGQNSTNKVTIKNEVLEFEKKRDNYASKHKSETKSHKQNSTSNKIKIRTDDSDFEENSDIHASRHKSETKSHGQNSTSSKIRIKNEVSEFKENGGIHSSRHKSETKSHRQNSTSSKISIKSEVSDFEENGDIPASKYKSENKRHGQNKIVVKNEFSECDNDNDQVNKNIKVEKSLNNVKKDNKESNKHSKIKKSKKLLKLEPTEAFTSSEATFEDCLSFNDIVPLKKKKSSKSHSITSTSEVPSKKNKIAHEVKSSHKNRDNISIASKSSNKSISVENKISSKSVSVENKISSKSVSVEDKISSRPVSPAYKQIPILKVDLSSTLPQTQPNYRPLPQKIYDYTPIKKKVMSNEDAIKFTSSRREKTAVYSGRKMYWTEVPTLFECCTRILIDNIDSIEYLGGIPYNLLEKVLKRCSARQLERIEFFNPDFLEDTDGLWQIHCERDFRTARPEENETWRELFLRTRDERAEKLKNVTANISASLAKSNPVRKAKLAYIDSVVKPPRDVARRQAKHGTASTVSHTIKPVTPSKSSQDRPSSPASNICSNIPSLTSSTASSSTSSGTSSHTSSGLSSSAASSSATSTSKAREIKPQKPKIAPLMAKTLKSMKQCFRR